MRIHKIKKNELIKYIDKIVYLHIQAFPNFFLTQLGFSFLKTLYSGYINDINSGIIIAEEDEDVIGFIAYSKDYSQFYKGLLKKHFVKFVLCSFLAALRHPSFTKRLFRALKKSDEVEKNVKYVELASIGVCPDYEGKGIGTKLINYLKKHINYEEFSYISLETDADNNNAANNFYKKNGFVKVRTFVTPEGRRMNEYHFGGES